MADQRPWYKQLWEGWKRIAAKIAHFQGHLILSLIYLLVVTPVAVLFRLFGQDPLALRFKKNSSYWSSRTPLPKVDEFLRKEY